MWAIKACMFVLLVALLGVAGLAKTSTGWATYYVFVLPEASPKSSGVANAVITFLVRLNELAGKGLVNAYWVLENYVAGGLEIPAGSIIVYAPYISPRNPPARPGRASW